MPESLDRTRNVSYFSLTMNWDWDKLQEKRQQQQKNGWGSVGKGAWGKREDDDLRADDREDEDRYQRKGGGPTGPKPPFTLPKMPKMEGGPRLRWLVLAALIVWVLSGIYIVQPDESGVVLRFGRYVRTEVPGPHIHLPYPIEHKSNYMVIPPSGVST